MTRKTMMFATGIAGIALTFALSLYLPDRVATHFSVSGEPNAWSSNAANTAFYVVIYLLMNVIFWGVGVLIRKLPPSLVNMPNREYWLAAERRDESVAAIAEFMAEFGAFINLYLMAIELTSFAANRTGIALSSYALVILGSAFALYLITWLVRFLHRFRKPA